MKQEENNYGGGTTMMKAQCYDCYYNSDNTCMKHEKMDNCECYEPKKDEDQMMKLQKSLP